MATALAIVQARMSSTRLPRKSLAEVRGEPMLSLLLKRLQRSREVERIVVATSRDSDDDQIGELAGRLGCGVHRGPLDDVLARFVAAAGAHPGPLVRITGDCPLVDPALVDDVVRLFNRTPDCDYASNVEPRTFPDGLDVEVISPAALVQINADTDDPVDREHVTAAIRRNLRAFVSAALTCEWQLGDLAWSVDTSDDLQFVREVVRRLGPRRYVAGMGEILEAVRRDPSLADYQGRRG